MKALIISDRQEIADYVTPLLKDKGFDIIRYKWIIKALDNIEEIQPDVIVLSANEYPRQWKTLAGFVQSGIGGKDAAVYLYDNEPLSDEDKDKASGLGVGLFEELVADPESGIKVELAYNNPDNNFIFCEGELFEKAGYIKVTDIVNEGFIKYLTVFDGESVKCFSAKVEKADDGCKLCMSESL